MSIYARVIYSTTNKQKHDKSVRSRGKNTSLPKAGFSGEYKPKDKRQKPYFLFICNFENCSLTFGP